MRVARVAYWLLALLVVVAVLLLAWGKLRREPREFRGLPPSLARGWAHRDGKRVAGALADAGGAAQAALDRLVLAADGEHSLLEASPSFLGDADARVRLAAVKILERNGKLTDAERVPLVADADAAVRRLVANGVGPTSAKELVSAMLASTDAIVKGRALVLAVSGGMARADVLAQLANAPAADRRLLLQLLVRDTKLGEDEAVVAMARRAEEEWSQALVAPHDGPTLEELLQRLRVTDEREREEALRALASRWDGAAERPLLGEWDRTARVAHNIYGDPLVFDALVTIGGDDTALLLVARLQAALAMRASGGDGSLAIRLIDTLGRIGSPSAQAYLLSLLPACPQPDSAWDVALAGSILKALRTGGCPDIAPVLAFERTRDFPDEDALDILAEAPRAEAEEALAELYDRCGGSDARNFVASRLRKVASLDLLRKLAARPDATGLWLMFLSEPPRPELGILLHDRPIDTDTWDERVIAALGDLATPEARDVLQRMVDAVPRDASPLVGWRALVPGPPVCFSGSDISELRDAMARADPDGAWRVGLLSAPHSPAALIPIILSCGGIPSGRRTPEMLRLSEDPDPMVRCAVVQSLIGLSLEGDLAARVDRMARADASARVRDMAARARDGRALPRLEAGSAWLAPSFAWAAVHGSVDWEQDPRHGLAAVMRLSAASRIDRGPFLEACRALGEIGDPVVIPDLESVARLLAPRDAEVAGHVLETIAVIPGDDSGTALASVATDASLPAMLRDVATRGLFLRADGVSRGFAISYLEDHGMSDSGMSALRCLARIDPVAAREQAVAISKKDPRNRDFILSTLAATPDAFEQAAEAIGADGWSDWESIRSNPSPRYVRFIEGHVAEHDALRALAQIRDEASARVLAQYLGALPATEAHAGLVWRRGERHPEADARALLARLSPLSHGAIEGLARDPRAGARVQAAVTIGLLPLEGAPERLRLARGLLADPVPMVRLCTLRSVDTHRSSLGAEIDALLRSDSAPRVRRAALRLMPS